MDTSMTIRKEMVEETKILMAKEMEERREDRKRRRTVERGARGPRGKAEVGGMEKRIKSIENDKKHVHVHGSKKTVHKSK